MRIFRFSVGEWITVVTLAIGVVIWLVRLEGRVNAQDLELQNNKEQSAQIREDLAYIRQRLDQAIERGIVR